MQLTHRWRQAFREGLATGGVASIASALVLAACGRRDNGRAAAPVNAVSHWIWHPEAFAHDEASLRHTLTGYLVHHGASVFWGTLHARAFGWREAAAQPVPAIAVGLTAAAAACFVDLRLTPDRLTPGFEHRLSARSLAVTYASFGLGLAIAAMVLRRRALAADPTQAQAITPR